MFPQMPEVCESSRNPTFLHTLSSRNYTPRTLFRYPANQVSDECIKPYVEVCRALTGGIQSVRARLRLVPRRAMTYSFMRTAKMDGSLLQFGVGHRVRAPSLP